MNSALPPPAKASIPFWVKCRACGHCWHAAYYPLDLSKFAKIAKRAVCPKCGDRKPLVARQHNGLLLEQQP